MATHYTPNTTLHEERELGHGAYGIFAARESGRHPDTGYPASLLDDQLNAPIAD